MPRDHGPSFAKMFNQKGPFHFDNFYEVAIRHAGVGEIFGPVRFVESAVSRFQVRKGEKAEAYGAENLGLQPDAFGQKRCSPDF